MENSTQPKNKGSERLKSVFLFGGAAVVVLVVHLTTNGNLGFHTDEFYYIDSGRHPALGYVDFPPIVPLLARLETDLLGATPWALRLLPTLLGAFMIILSGVYVRRLGGSLGLQALALLIAVTAPYFLGANWVYQTVTFDEVTWMVALYCFLRLVLEHREQAPLSEKGFVPSDAAMFTWASVSPAVARLVNRTEKKRLNLLKRVIGDSNLTEVLYLVWLGFVARGQRLPKSRKRFPQIACTMLALFPPKKRNKNEPGQSNG